MFNTGANPCRTGALNDTVFYREAQRDAASGVYQMGARAYDPQRAGFVQPDAYRTDGSNLSLLLNPRTANAYSYADGDPLNLSDPSGHDPWYEDAPGYTGTPGEHSQTLNDVITQEFRQIVQEAQRLKTMSDKNAETGAGDYGGQPAPFAKDQPVDGSVLAAAGGLGVLFTGGASGTLAGLSLDNLSAQDSADLIRSRLDELTAAGGYLDQNGWNRIKARKTAVSVWDLEDALSGERHIVVVVNGDIKYIPRPIKEAFEGATFLTDKAVKGIHAEDGGLQLLQDSIKEGTRVIRIASLSVSRAICASCQKLIDKALGIIVGTTPRDLSTTPSLAEIRHRTSE
jgi:RHS repeat-associated protein